MTDADDVQSCESKNPEFYKSGDWWWDHQRLRFLNDKLGLKALLFLVPIAWVATIFVSLFFGFLGLTEWLRETWNIPAILFTIYILIASVAYLALSLYLVALTTNWVIGEGLGFLLRPFEKTLKKKADAAIEDGMSEFNRITGQVRFAKGKGEYFEAPFIEFDAYVERVIMQSGVFYRLMFIHRYTGKIFNKTWLSGVEPSIGEILAMWDMLQRFMDVDQPLPDMPRFEPFRHLDPVTAEHDRKTNRPPRYWRDLDLEVWKEKEELKRVRAQAQYPWSRRRCKLTPKLGQIEMAAYREKRPESAVLI